jgi:putative ABC transport system permease protein
MAEASASTTRPDWRRPPRMTPRGQRPPVGSRGAAIAVAAAVGLLVGLRAILSPEAQGIVPLLRVTTLPRDAVGLAWSDLATWPAEAQVAAWLSLCRTLAALTLSAAAVATLNAVVVLAESSTSRTRELAIRSALGAPTRTVVLGLVSELRTLLAAGAALGLLAGLLGGAAARWAWPDALSPVLEGDPWPLVVALCLVMLVLVGAHVVGITRSLRAPHSVDALRGGSRVGASRGAVFVRHGLAAIHTAVAASVLLAAAVLVRSAPGAADPDDLRPGDSWVIEVAGGDGVAAWRSALEAVAALPAVQAESLAAPGALLGLGIRDIAIAECGQCSRGGLPAPLWNALADHHVVAPDFFELTGGEFTDGRDFTLADDADAPPVAIVNETFARTAFEGGRPIGKQVRVGSDPSAWYTVVGIVQDVAVPTLGADAAAREAVYLSALQAPPSLGRILVRGPELAAVEARDVLERQGFEARVPVTLSAFRADAARAIRWSAWLSTAMALVVLFLAAHGTFVVAGQTTRRRSADVAVRRAVGATAGAIVRLVLHERLRVTGWGLAGFVFFGTLVSAFVQDATGLDGTGPGLYVAIGALLGIVALSASLRAALEASAVDPVTLLD